VSKFLFKSQNRFPQKSQKRFVRTVLDTVGVALVVLIVLAGLLADSTGVNLVDILEALEVERAAMDGHDEVKTNLIVTRTVQKNHRVLKRS